MAHDATPFRDLGVTRLGRVRILADSFIGENTIIMPGVTIGPRAMVAAGSVVSRDVGEGVLAAGNPARVYGKYEEYLDRIRATVRTSLVVRANSLGNPACLADVLAALDRRQEVFVRDASDRPLHFHNITDADVRQAALEVFARHFPDLP
jgi:tetrahydrodipicolinate N-succinyltransferase